MDIVRLMVIIVTADEGSLIIAELWLIWEKIHVWTLNAQSRSHWHISDILGARRWWRRTGTWVIEPTKDITCLGCCCLGLIIVENITYDIGSILTDIKLASVLQEACIWVNQLNPGLHFVWSTLAIWTTCAIHIDQGYGLTIRLDHRLDILR